MDISGLEYAAENMENAVMQFYKEPTNDELNKFLTEAQSSKEAWRFIWELLKIDKPYVVQYYGANTLHFKVSKDWHQISDDNISSLQNSLLQLLESHSNGVRALTIKICICLSCFILQTVTQQWPNALEELKTYALQPVGADAETKTSYQKNMLEILTMIPEEYSKTDMPRHKVLAVGNRLATFSNSVFQLIHQLLVEPCHHEIVKAQAINCFTSWLDFGTCITRPENEALVFLLFDFLRSPAYFLETAKALRQLFKVRFTQKNFGILKYLKKIADLSSLFESLSDDIEVSQGLTKVIVSAAKKGMDVILSSIGSNDEFSQTAIDLIRLLVNTVSIRGQYPTEEHSSDLSFSFWCDLQSHVTHKDYPSHVKEMTTELLLEVFGIVLSKAKYPPDYCSWKDDDKHAFKCFRSHFADLMASCACFVGSQCMTWLIQLLENQVKNFHNNIQVEWQNFEVVIYGITAIVGYEKRLLIDDLKKIYKLLPYVPCTHVTLINGIMSFLGGCATFVNKDMFNHSIDFILKGIRQKEITSTASASLKELIIIKREMIAPLSEEILQGLNETMDKEDLMPSDYLNMISCLGYVLPVVPQYRALRTIEVIFLKHFSVLLNVTNTPQSVNIVMQKLDLLWNFFMAFSLSDEYEKEIQPDHFIFKFVNELTSCVKNVISILFDNKSIMDHLCKVLKRALRSLDLYVKYAIPNFANIICFSCSIKMLPSMFHFANFLFDTCRDKKIQPILQSAFVSICNYSMLVFRENSPIQTEDMEAFMDFLIRIEPSLLRCNFDCLSRLFVTAVEGIKSKKDQLHKDSCQVLFGLMIHTDLTRIIQLYGERLIEVVIAVAINLPTDKLDPLVNIIAVLIGMHQIFARDALAKLLAMDQFPVPHASRQNKEQFHEKILSSKTKKNIKNTIDEFASLWREIPESKVSTS